MNDFPPSSVEKLREAISFGSAALSPILPFADTTALLGALAEVESNFGALNVPKHEAAYDVGGIYFNEEQRERWSKWGSWAACSYSSFQILFTTACELGFRGAPIELWDDTVAVHFVVEFIKRRFLARGGTQVRDFADCWNSGTHLDANIPTAYVDRFMNSYRVVKALRGLG